MNTFYFKDYESTMKEWNRLNKLLKSTVTRNKSGKILKGISEYKKKYASKDGSQFFKVVDGKVVRWDTRTNEAYDEDVARDFVTKNYNIETYGTETPNKDFDYVNKVKQYYELKGYKEGTLQKLEGTDTSKLQNYEARNKLNIFGQRGVTEEGKTGLDIKIEKKLESLKKDSYPLFENSSYFDKNIDALLNKNTENSVSLKDASVNNRTQLLTNNNIALDTTQNANVTRELAINPR
tara:strand:- start:1834 stop:2541 length:708 start_codon:yes stop_codon:yes gene_type:complete